MTRPAERSVARVSWSYDVLEPLPQEVQDKAFALLDGSGVEFHESRVYTYGVSYVARHSPREKKLFTALSELMPKRFL